VLSKDDTRAKGRKGLKASLSRHTKEKIEDDNMVSKHYSRDMICLMHDTYNVKSLSTA
jgi:hypothetical protein